MIRIGLIGAIAAVCIYLCIALALVASQGVDALARAGDSIDFTNAIEADYRELPDLQPYPTRADDRQFYRLYPAPQASVRLVLVHGSAWHGMQFHEMARALSQTGVAEVVVPDMRGHGSEATHRGDIAHIGQLEDDMADLITHLSSKYGARRTVLGGHSSGGGFTVRFAAGSYSALADGFVLLAPYLQHNAPTTRPDSGGWARPAVRRIVGLTMLNQVGITALNHLPTIAFDMPRAVIDGPLGHTATTNYSFRLMTGFAPRADFEAEIKAIASPFLVVAGSADEAFDSSLYEPVMSALNSRGTYHVIDGASHIDMLTDTRAIEVIRRWLAD